MLEEDIKQELNESSEAEEQKEELEEAPKEEDINSIFPGATPIEKPNKDDPAYDDVIEQARLAFMKVIKKNRIASFIAMGVVLAIAVASVIFIGMTGMGWKIAGWVLIGSAVLGMIIFYIVSRNIVPNATKEYIAVVNKQMNMRNFMDGQFTEVSTDKNEKMELADPISDAIYSNIANIASRNVINGKFDGRTFKVADMGLYSGAGKQRTSAFVGKYVSYPNDLHFEGRYILVFKGQVPTDLPSDINDLVILHEGDDMLVYGKEGNKYESDLGKDFFKEIKKVSVERHLLNLNVVIWSGHSAAYASYDDKIMTLPYQENYNKESNEQYADDLLQIFNSLKLLVKKEK